MSHRTGPSFSADFALRCLISEIGPSAWDMIPMSPLPAALLGKFYERDSLRNTEKGFELRFKNRLAPSTIVGFGPLTVDGAVYEGEHLTMSLERPARGYRPPPEPLVRSAKSFDKGRSLPFEINTVLRISVAGAKLAPGSHQVALTIKTKEVGDIVVTAEDRVAVS